MAQKISQEIQDEALRVARGIQRPSQTKEQTKLIAKGIEQGIVEYKKQQKAKARQSDRAKKKPQLVHHAIEQEPQASSLKPISYPLFVLLPWLLLVLSWVSFGLMY